MELINNRYRVEEIKEQENLYSKYVVLDLLQKNKRLLLYVINNTQYSSEFLSFCNEEFYQITSMQHPNLLQVYNYGIIETIDDKQINELRFYYTTEYIDVDFLIDENYQLSEEEFLNIYTQGALVLDYLHFHGHIYKFIGLDTVFVYREENKLRIKLLDLVSIKKYEIHKRYIDEMTVSCRAPELTYGIEVGSYTDIYSLGAFLFYLYTNQEFQYHKLLNKVNRFENSEFNSREYKIFDTIKRMTYLDFFERFQSIHQLNRHMQKIFALEEVIEDKSLLEKLNFKTPIIGRDIELKEILSLNSKSNKNLVLVHGDKGIGKTRFIREIMNQMKWKGFKIFGTTTASNNEHFYKISASLIKNMLKIIPTNIVNKYACELIKIIPEIGVNKSIIPTRPLTEDKEILKLYDRVSNFIIEGTQNKPTLLIIDDFHFVDHTVAEFIDYFLKISRLKKAPIIVILSYIEDELVNDSNKSYIGKWQADNSTLVTKLSRLTVEETAKIIRYILGWNQEPLNFATRVMKESDGIPAYIEEAMRELFAQKLIIVDYSTKYDGYAWHKTTDDYAQIKIADNIDEAAVKQFETFDSATKDILKIISLFNTSVSLEIITEIYGEKEDLAAYLRRLTQLRILNEKLEDWGYTYGFFRKQLKSYIYNTIENKMRIDLHLHVSTILEELYIREGRENKDELIFHLLQSNQRNKAIDYCIDAGDRMFNLKVFSQASVFYMRAHSLIEEDTDKRKLSVFIKIGDVYQNQGNIKEAIKYFKKVIKLANHEDQLQLTIEAGSRIGYIYLYRNELDIAEQFFLKAVENAEAIDYQEGLLKSAYLLSRVYMFNRKLDKLEAISRKYLEVAQQLKRIDYVGMFLSQIGVNYFYRAKEVKALSLFKESVVYLEKANNIEDTCRPINNIGVILQDHFQDSKQAREYFEKSLKIAQQYNRVEDIIVAYNNIADSLMIDHKANEAIEILNKNVLLAQEYEEENIKIISYINLIECFIDISDYKNAYNYLIKTQNEELAGEGGAYRGNLLYVMCRFYMELGQYNKAKEMTEKFFKEYEHNESRHFYLMKKLQFMVLNYNKEPMEDSCLLQLIDEYSKSSFTRDYRLILLEDTIYFSEKGQLEIAKELLAKDEELINQYNNDYFNSLRLYINGILYHQSDFIEYVEETLIPSISNSSKDLKCKIYKKLAEAYLEVKDYYRAATHYFNGLELIQLILNRTPDEFKHSYFSREDKYKITHQLLKMKKVILNEKSEDNYNYQEPTEENISLDDIFDISRYQELFNNPAFYQLALEQYKNLFPIDLDNIQQLIESLTNDIDYNLDISMKYAGKLTLATRGMLVGIYEDDYDVIASFGEEIDVKSKGYIFEKSATMKKGIIIENSFVHSLDAVNDDFYKDFRELMVLPIINKAKAIEPVEKDQRYSIGHEKEKIIGYLYLETNKIFNNFSTDTLKECEKLIPLLSLMFNNYYLKISSSIDKLTGTYIRKYFEKVLAEEIKHAKESNEGFSIIMCDIDHFKNVNDTYGHQRGDMVLSEAGSIIRDSIRSSDYAGRYGGEEFIILLPRALKMDALLVAEKIRTKFKDEKLLGEGVELTISCGIACYPIDGENKETIIERADQALYTAKEQGRNQSVIWEEGIRFVDKRVDKLAGIVTGNIVQDQRNVLVLAEAIEIITEEGSREEKIYTLLGRLIEILEAEDGILFIVKDNQVTTQYARKRFLDDWIRNYTFNNKLIEKVMQTKQGEYLIDWEDVSHIDLFTGTPNWKSVIITPIIFDGELRGIIYLSVAVKEKEFDFSGYNLAKLTSNILGAVIAEI